MGLKVLNPLIKTVAKKAYVPPKIEVRPLNSRGTGDVVQFSRYDKSRMEDAGEFIRKNWDIRVDWKKVNIYEKSNGHCLKSIEYYNPNKAKQAANDLLKLNEPLVMYREGEYIIIEAKEGSVINLSKIDRLIGNSNIIARFRTPEEAKQAAKDLIMKQFEKPLYKQIECGITVEGKNITGITYGDCCSTKLSKPLFGDWTADYYHNHPDDAEAPIQAVLSGIGSELNTGFGDIPTMLREKVRSITAYNHLGEYNTAEVVDIPKATEAYGVYGYKLVHELKMIDAIRQLGKEKGMKWVNVQNKWAYMNKKHIETSEELEKEYRLLLKEYEKVKHAEIFDKELNQWMHKCYLELLPKYGVKYTTNYSNLANDTSHKLSSGQWINGKWITDLARQ